MGTSLLKTAALLGILSAAVTQAYCAGAAAPGGTAGAAGAATGNVGQIGPATAGTIAAMPGTIAPSIGGQTPGTGNPTLTNQPLSNRTLSNHTLANRTLANQTPANQGLTDGGLVGGLSPSQQDFLMNFASPTSAGGPSPTEQMQSKAQANAESALRSASPLSMPPGGNVAGSTAATGGASLQNGAVTTAPAVSAPVVNNPGTLAETLPPAR